MKTMALDLIVKGGLIIDGTGSSPFIGDIGVFDGEIVMIGSATNFNARRILDARGLVVAPGFIDPCPCGIGNRKKFTKSYLSQGITTGLEICTGDEEINALIKKNNLNMFFLVDITSLRQKQVKWKNRPLENIELELLLRETERLVEKGARGLIFRVEDLEPWRFVEMEHLAGLARKKNIVFSLAMNSPGLLSMLLEKWTGEFASLVVAAGGKLHIHSLYNFPERETVDSFLEKLDTMSEAGLEVTFDRVPYTGSMVPLTALLGFRVKKIASRRLLEDPLLRAEARKEIRKRLENCCDAGHFLITSTGEIMEAFEPFAGRKLLELKNLGRNGDLADGIIRAISIQDGAVSLVHFSLRMDEIQKLLSRKYSFLAASEFTASECFARYAHPCHAGAFPRAIREFAIKARNISPERLIKRMTGDVAYRFGLPDRGLIKKGLFADLVIFELAGIDSKADFRTPSMAPCGIRYVVREGKVLDTLSTAV